MMRVLSWNTAKKLAKIELQSRYIKSHNADIIALQEILPSTDVGFKKAMRGDYPYSVSSFDLADDKTVLTKKRMFGQIILSKFPLVGLDPKAFDIPWTERVLSVEADTPYGLIDVHTTHIPPGSSNGWTKIEMLNGIVDYFHGPHRNAQILCGDFNTPKDENFENGIITFGQRLNNRGRAVLKKSFRGGLGYDWDMGERSLFKTNDTYKLRDLFREQHPNDYTAFSWEFTRKGKNFRTRFDHIFADDKLTCSNCFYSNTQNSLSDHSPIIADFK